MLLYNIIFEILGTRASNKTGFGCDSNRSVAAGRRLNNRHKAVHWGNVENSVFYVTQNDLQTVICNDTLMIDRLIISQTTFQCVPGGFYTLLSLDVMNQRPCPLTILFLYPKFLCLITLDMKGNREKDCKCSQMQYLFWLKTKRPWAWCPFDGPDNRLSSGMTWNTFGCFQSVTHWLTWRLNLDLVFDSNSTSDLMCSLASTDTLLCNISFCIIDSSGTQKSAQCYSSFALMILLVNLCFQWFFSISFLLYWHFYH